MTTLINPTLKEKTLLYIYGKIAKFYSYGKNIRYISWRCYTMESKYRLKMEAMRIQNKSKPGNLKLWCDCDDEIKQGQIWRIRQDVLDKEDIFPVKKGGYTVSKPYPELEVKVEATIKNVYNDDVKVRNGNSPTRFVYDREKFLSLFELKEK
jgi:hypothetical protein